MEGPYSHFNETQSKNQSKSYNDDRITTEDITTHSTPRTPEQIKDFLLKHYEAYGNLDAFEGSDNVEWNNLIEDVWKLVRKKQLAQEKQNINDENLTDTTKQKAPTWPNKDSLATRNSNKNKSSQNYMKSGHIIPNLNIGEFNRDSDKFKRDCLDLDDLIQTEFPNEFHEDKHEDTLRRLGFELIESRLREMNITIPDVLPEDMASVDVFCHAEKERDLPEIEREKRKKEREKIFYEKMRRKQISMKNDDFFLLLCLLKKKKEKMIEKDPYVMDYGITWNNVKTNEKGEGSNKLKNDIQSFVQTFLNVDKKI